jgi:hypothetical protein
LRYYIEIMVAENAVGYSICSFIECAATQFNYMNILSQTASIAPTGCHCPCRCHCHHRLHYRHRHCRRYGITEVWKVLDCAALGRFGIARREAGSGCEVSRGF